MSLLQLERILQSQGFGSRRECRTRIRAGHVRLWSAAHTEPVRCDDPLSVHSTDGLELLVNGEPWRYRERVYLAMNKPRGLECSHAPTHHQSVFSLLPRPLVVRGVQCAGRLDEDTTGLLLLSDDGQVVHALASSRRGVPKVYELTLAAPCEPRQLEALRAGVELDDEREPVRAGSCELLGERSLRLTISQGRYHQVKRMVAAAGNHVEALARVAIGTLSLPADLAPGQWRYLERSEVPVPG